MYCSGKEGGGQVFFYRNRGKKRQLRGSPRPIDHEPRDGEMLREIMAVRALAGSAITLVLHFPSPVFQIGESQFAVDKNAAVRIRV
jgi:hypothetical protein